MGQSLTLVDSNSGERVRIGSFPFVIGRSQRADWPIVDPSVARRHFQFVESAGALFVEPLDGSVLLAGAEISSRTQIPSMTTLSAGNSQFEVVLDSPVQPSKPRSVDTKPKPAAPRVSNTQQTMINAGDLGALMETPTENYTLGGQMLAGRDVGQAQIHLPHGMVSRSHAMIQLHPGGALHVKDLGSANGTFVDGVRIFSETIVPIGSRIDIGPYSLVFDGQRLQSQTRQNNVQLVARNVTRVVTNPETREPLTILNRINVVAEPGQLVCILGPSGSGKSTLLSILSCRANPSDGQVFLNKQDLHENFDSLRTNIAVVPQKDCIHDLLSIEEAWRYTSRLRLPSDMSKQEIDGIIEEMLETVALTEHRHKQIRMLSGGQLKRAVLGNEMLAQPSLLFLDEVTSGLDEQTDRDVMQLFQKIAHDQKTVICITHNLANVESNCDRLILLTAGGYLAFVGSPRRAMEYFEIQRLGDIYKALQSRAAVDWRDQFAESRLYADEVDRRMPGDLPEQDTEPKPIKIDTGKEYSLIRKQTPVLAERYSKLLRADWMNLLAMLGQAALVAFLLVTLFGDLNDLTADDAADADTLLKAGVDFDPVDVKKSEYAQKILFLLSVSCFWFGCNNSAKELVKEREIFTRERDVNLSTLAYFVSKLGLMSLVVVAQVLLLTLTVTKYCSIPGSLSTQLTTLIVLAVTGVATGLFISAVSGTEDMAVAAVPVILIPQIILAGLIAPIEGAMLSVTRIFVSCYSGFRALTATLPEPLNEIAEHDGVSNSTWTTVLVVQTLVICVCAVLLLLNSRTQARLLISAKQAGKNAVKMFSKS